MSAPKTRTYPSSHAVPINPRQHARFFASPSIVPLPPSTPLSELTTHEYPVQVQPHLKLTIKLINSQSPKGADRGLFFVPGKVMGEVVFEVVEKATEGVLEKALGDKTEEKLDSVIVSIVGRDLGAGYWNSQAAMITNPGIDNIGHEFFSRSTTNILVQDSSSAGKSPTSISGVRSFPFSIDIPDTYDPKAGEGKHHKGGLLTKLKGAIEHHGAESETGDTDESDKAELQRLPPSALPHEDITMEDTGDIVAVYTVTVSATMHSLMDPHIKLSEPIVLLPLDEQLTSAPADPPMYTASETKGMNDYALNEPARSTVDIPSSAPDMKRSQA